MWDLNDSPDQQRDIEDSEGCSSQKTSIDCDYEKGKQVGSVSNSSSSAVVIENGSDEEVGGERGLSLEKPCNSRRIFGVSLSHGEAMEESEPPVTRQFFPVDQEQELETEATPSGATVGFPRANWVGVKFCQSEPSGAGKSVEVPQPMKKSRRGPRSRSSQYRGVTFYRRTGRWESHIWFVFWFI